ncbi:hypothetical protein [Arcticibacter sp.]|jgi:hypothetical protein|uniref:hypothetical protein n=1 Tax=Arcticibacter sp. TaxID=1872630 RepID=UPI00388FA129
MAINLSYSPKNTYLRGMIRKFTKEISGTEFEFNPMNILKLQLFQVYVKQGDIRYRFHMEVNQDGIFKISDPVNCPAEYLPLEPALSDAILSEGEE